jgi:hypothetical protein
LGGSDGSIYFMTGNGNENGPDPPRDFRNSFVKLQAKSGVLSAAGWFRPTNVRELDICDIDLGSAGPVQLPGTQFIAGAGKEGVLYLLDMKTMKAIQQFQATSIQYPADPNKHACPTSSLDFEVMRFFPHVHGSPVVWPVQQPGSLLYLWAEQDFLRSFVFNATRSRLDVAAVSTVKTPQNSMPGGVLSFSANDRAAGTGIVWATRPLDCTDNNTVLQMPNRSCNGEYKAVAGILHAFDAITLEELWNSERKPSDRLGLLGKFSPPTVTHGKVFVSAFGDPNPAICSDALSQPLACIWRSMGAVTNACQLCGSSVI